MKKGLSMTALIMYVTILTIVVGMIVAFNVNVLSDSNNFVKSTKMYEQYTKFNMFFLQVLGENPTVEVISDDVAVIYSTQGSGMFEYDSTNKQVIYTNVGNRIVVCEYVDLLEFSEVDNTLRTDIQFKIGDIEFRPQVVNYAVGGWAQ